MVEDRSAKPDEAEIARDLVRRIEGGDDTAEGELVERYSRGVSFLLRRWSHNSALAEDLHQETFRIVLERLRSSGLEEPAKLAGFLRATARNLYIGDYRKRMRRQTEHYADEMDREPDPAPNPLSLVIRHERAQLVRRLIGELRTERDRQLLFRFYILEEDKESICAELGLGGLHFNRVLFRARQRFKQLLEQSAESNGQREVV